MDYITIKDWKKFQHYDKRKPPWIKLYRELLDDLEYHKLEPKAAKYLILIWLLASENNGQVKLGEDLCFRLRLSEKEVKSIISDIKHFCVQDASTMLAECYQDDTLETETEREKETETEIKKYGSFENVKLSNEEYDKLKDRFGIGIGERIEKLSEYMASKGKRYSSHYATILAWSRKENEQTKDKKEDPWLCRNCGKKASSIIGGLCPKCHDLVSQQSSLGLKGL